MIRKTVVLACDPQRAFELFTERAGQWWPADRRHTNDAASSIFVEPGGRFFERSRAGAEVELGVVRVFEPPRRLVLDWYPGTGPKAPTRLEVRFEAEADGTRVTITHTAGAAGDERFNRNAKAYRRSWDSVLAALRST
jgi:uncharacterized protein YndB with AHSA1/START domain